MYMLPSTWVCLVPGFHKDGRANKIALYMYIYGGSVVNGELQPDAVLPVARKPVA